MGLPWWFSSEESACNAGTADVSYLSLGQEEPLEESMATHSSILSWRISMDRWAGGLQFMGLQRITTKAT